MLSHSPRLRFRLVSVPDAQSLSSLAFRVSMSSGHDSSSFDPDIGSYETILGHFWVVAQSRVCATFRRLRRMVRFERIPFGINILRFLGDRLREWHKWHEVPPGVPIRATFYAGFTPRSESLALQLPKIMPDHESGQK